MHIGFFSLRSIKCSLGVRSKSRQQRRRARVAEPLMPADFPPFPSSPVRARAESEARILCYMLAAAGILFVGGALLGNAVSVLFSLFAALACVTRVEQKRRNGDYGDVREESID